MRFHQVAILDVEMSRIPEIRLRVETERQKRVRDRKV
jgi:hypothetical protein